MSGFQIRPAGQEDLDSLARLFAAHLDEQAGWDRLFARSRNPAFDSLRFITRSWQAGLQQFLVADDGSRLLGFIRFSIQPAAAAAPRPSRRKGPRSLTWGRLLRAASHYLLRWAERWPDPAFLTRGVTTGYLADLYVLPAARRQGMGTRLVQATLRCFAEQGIPEVYLQVVDQNQAGVEFWKKMGFVPHRHTLVHPGPS